MFDALVAQLSVVAVLVQRVIALVKLAYEDSKYARQINIVLSVVLSSLVCLAWNIDALAVAKIILPANVAWIGAVLTGAIAGVGSNTLNDVLVILRMWKERKQAETAIAQQYADQHCYE